MSSSYTKGVDGFLKLLSYHTKIKQPLKQPAEISLSFPEALCYIEGKNDKKSDRVSYTAKINAKVDQELGSSTGTVGTLHEEMECLESILVQSAIKSEIFGYILNYPRAFFTVLPYSSPPHGGKKINLANYDKFIIVHKQYGVLIVDVEFKEVTNGSSADVNTLLEGTLHEYRSTNASAITSGDIRKYLIDTFFTKDNFHWINGVDRHIALKYTNPNPDSHSHATERLIFQISLESSHIKSGDSIYSTLSDTVKNSKSVTDPAGVSARLNLLASYMYYTTTDFLVHPSVVSSNPSTMSTISFMSNSDVQHYYHQISTILETAIDPHDITAHTSSRISSKIQQRQQIKFKEEEEDDNDNDDGIEELVETLMNNEIMYSGML